MCAALGLPAAHLRGRAVARRAARRAPAVPPAPAVSRFPVATQDVALVVDAASRPPTSRRRCATGAGPLLESVRLFDVYTGEQVGEGRKSLAYSLRFRAADRTLTAEEAAAARDAAVEEAARRVAAVRAAMTLPPRAAYSGPPV